MTTNDHRLSCYGCAVPPGAHLVPGGEVVMRERFFGAFLTRAKNLLSSSHVPRFVRLCLGAMGLLSKNVFRNFFCVCVCVCDVLSVGDVTARGTFAILVSYADYGRGHAIRIGADSA